MAEVLKKDVGKEGGIIDGSDDFGIDSLIVNNLDPRFMAQFFGGPDADQTLAALDAPVFQETDDADRIAQQREDFFDWVKDLIDRHDQLIGILLGVSIKETRATKMNSVFLALQNRFQAIEGDRVQDDIKRARLVDAIEEAMVSAVRYKNKCLGKPRANFTATLDDGEQTGLNEDFEFMVNLLQKALKARHNEAPTKEEIIKRVRGSRVSAITPFDAEFDAISNDLTNAARRERQSQKEKPRSRKLSPARALLYASLAVSGVGGIGMGLTMDRAQEKAPITDTLEAGLAPTTLTEAQVADTQKDVADLISQDYQEFIALASVLADTCEQNICLNEAAKGLEAIEMATTMDNATAVRMLDASRMSNSAFGVLSQLKKSLTERREEFDFELNRLISSIENQFGAEDERIETLKMIPRVMAKVEADLDEGLEALSEAMEKAESSIQNRNFDMRITDFAPGTKLEGLIALFPLLNDGVPVDAETRIVINTGGQVAFMKVADIGVYDDGTNMVSPDITLDEQIRAISPIWKIDRLEEPVGCVWECGSAKLVMPKRLRTQVESGANVDVKFGFHNGHYVPLDRLDAGAVRETKTIRFRNGSVEHIEDFGTPKAITKTGDMFIIPYGVVIPENTVSAFDAR